MGLTREQATFYWLNISGGGIGLVLLFFTTLLSRNAKKHPVLLNLYFCCIFEAYLACLLCVTFLLPWWAIPELRSPRFFVGRYTREEGGESIPQVKAGSPLCVVQALLFTPTPVLYVPSIVQFRIRSTLNCSRLAGAAFALVFHVCLQGVVHSKHDFSNTLLRSSWRFIPSAAPDPLSRAVCSHIS